MIKLYDRLTQDSLDLEYSLQTAGFEGTGVVLQDDGFLPNGLTSPFEFFAGQEKETPSPLYFNEVKVPAYWQITGTNQQGEIWDYGQKKAIIFYHEPKHLRLVKTVEWLDTGGKVRQSEHYNQYGRLFAKTYFNSQQEPTHKHYFDSYQRPYFMENFVTGDMTLDWRGKTYYFAKKVDFYLFYLRNSGLDLSQIYYNSLGMPFLLAYYLGGEGQDVLFWQEDMGDQIPGNMQLLLNGNIQRSTRVIVQKRESYNRLLDLANPEQKEKIDFLSYLYPSLRENEDRKEILILTNTDQLQGLATLIAELPDYHFHIAALTEMSQQLVKYAENSNVSLYPNAGFTQIQQLFASCDIYLDINHGSEIMAAVRTAFESNLLILAFDNTCHHHEFLVPEAIFDHRQPSQLAAWLNQRTTWADTVQEQRSQKGYVGVQDYQLKLKG